MHHAQIEVFLALAEELHFGRVAERLYISQPRVSRLVASLEQEVGGPLFERSSRRVRLTPLGVRFGERLRPAYAQLEAAFDDARATARNATGLLRIGFMATTAGEALNHLVEDFERRHPDCEVVLREVAMADPFGPLRRAEVDVLFYWLVGDEADLTAGPPIAHDDRVLAVATDHPLAAAETVSIEDLGGENFAMPPPTFPTSLVDLILPPTPSGRRFALTYPIQTISELWVGVASGRIVHPTVASMSAQVHRDDIVLIPIRDLPPIALGPTWCTAHENARIRAFAQVAADQCDDCESTNAHHGA